MKKSFFLWFLGVAAVSVFFLFPSTNLSGRAPAPETRNECLTRCLNERLKRDSTCPPGGQYTDVARQKCLDASATDYRNCTASCPKDPPRKPAP